MRYVRDGLVHLSWRMERSGGWEGMVWRRVVGALVEGWWSGGGVVEWGRVEEDRIGGGEGGGRDKGGLSLMALGMGWDGSCFCG